MSALSPTLLLPFHGARQLNNNTSDHDQTANNHFSRFNHHTTCDNHYYYSTCSPSCKLSYSSRDRAVSRSNYRTPRTPCPPHQPNTPPPDLARLQAKQSSLAKAAMSNQRAAAAPTPLSSSTQLPPTSAPSTASTYTTATTTTTQKPAPAPAHKQPSPTIAVQPDPSDVKQPGSNDGALTPISIDGSHLTPPQGSPHRFRDNLLPQPAVSISSHPTSLASALRAVKDSGDGREIDSPYAKSVSSTAPASPRIPPLRQNSGSQTPRVRPHATTLSIPGMTRSLISPDGKIADRDVASKLVIIMVGLPARGKSYITKKIKRYLAWQQHEVEIFNVGSRRRGDAKSSKEEVPEEQHTAQQAANALLNGGHKAPLPESASGRPKRLSAAEGRHAMRRASTMDQTAQFFDPTNAEASQLREQIAIQTLNELLDYLLCRGGSIGILDATNSTIHRRQLLFDSIKAREPKLGILFVESVCQNPDLLEANMRLKLSGPDYKDKDPVQSLADFKDRVKAYESAYEPLGDYEEDHAMQYIKMIDVGKKLTHFGLEGFLSNGISHYLSSFNLSPRQIWLTRHGQSMDNHAGKIGGNADLTERGHLYSLNLYTFITQKRKEWLVEQKSKAAASSFPPIPGDKSPPYPELNRELDEKNTCVWTSMLTRSIQTAQYFEADDDYDVKNWEMLNELNAGKFEGMTYDGIARDYRSEYEKRQRDKLSYVYPGVGGEGYLQVISRLRDMVREIERIKDHVLIIGHRSVCRVLLAYFMDLTRDDIADLDMPLGMVYCIEPKPYGIEFHAYKYNEIGSTFDELPNYKPQKTIDRHA